MKLKILEPAIFIARFRKLKERFFSFFAVCAIFTAFLSLSIFATTAFAANKSVQPEQATLSATQEALWAQFINPLGGGYEYPDISFDSQKTKQMYWLSGFFASAGVLCASGVAQKAIRGLKILQFQLKRKS